MRYIVVDQQGASRLSFRSLSETRDWTHALSETDPDRLADLLIERFNDDGQIVGRSQWADDFLRELGESMVPFERGDGRRALFRGDLSQVLHLAFRGALLPQHPWSGMTSTTGPWSFRQCERAIGTVSPAQAETAAS